MRASTDNTEKALTAFLKYATTQAKANLTRQKINASKNLYNSIKYDVKVSNSSFEASISMEEYGEYQDKGVKGAKKSTKAPKSPFKFGTGTAPKGKFKGNIDRWVVRKGIAPRDKGKFQERERMVFQIMKSIFNTGIRTTNFLTKPVEAGFKKLPDEIIEAYGLDVETFLKYLVK